MQLNSHVVKTNSSVLGNVLLLNTMNKAHFVTADEQMKPIVYKIYYFTKGEINIPDQHMKSYTTKSKTRKSTTLQTTTYLIQVELQMARYLKVVLVLV